MMSEFFLQKKELVRQVYNKAKSSTTETSFSGILKNLEYTLLDDFRILLSYKTLETYYKNLVENNRDYKIKTTILNDLSRYLGYSDFNEFCDKNLINTETTKVKVSIDGNETTKETKHFSDIIINITNSPIFNFPEFFNKHQNSFGILGIILVAGFIFNNPQFLNFGQNKNLKTDVIALKTNDIIKATEVPKISVNFSRKKEYNTVKVNTNDVMERKKECMYWDDDHYEAVFCDELIEGKEIIALNQEKMLLKKIGIVNLKYIIDYLVSGKAILKNIQS